jgi:hypothetical protein
MRWTREEKIGAGIAVAGLTGLAWWIFGSRGGGTPGIDAEAPPLGVQATASVVSAAGAATTWSDGSRSVERQDGSVQVTRTDGTTVTQRTDGMVETRRPDGTTTTTRTPALNVPLPHPEPGRASTAVKDPGEIPFDRVTTGPTFEACMRAGRRFQWWPGDPAHPPGCTATRWPGGGDPRERRVTARETIRDVQRRLLDGGFYNNPDGSRPADAEVVDGRIGARTTAALLAYQMRFNETMGFGPPSFIPDGSVRQSRTPFLPVSGHLDLLTASMIAAYLE